MNCLDCGLETADWEDYQLYDHVWALTGVPQMGGVLCVGCCEARLGRTLIEEDFHRLSLSDTASPRLQSRGDMRWRYGKSER